MKKLLSVIFMVLCGITAIHADDPASVTPTLQDQRDNVACGTTVTMQATPKPNYHFSKWVKQDANGTEDIDVNTQNSSYTCTTDAKSGVNTLTVYLTGGMIDDAQEIQNITYKYMLRVIRKYFGKNSFRFFAAS